MRILLLCALIFCLLQAGAPAFGAGPRSVSVRGGIRPDWSYAEKRLLKEGFSRSLVANLKSKYEASEFTNVLELNLLLFMRKTDDHGVQITDSARSRVDDFLSANKAAFEKAEKDYGVPAPVIASLLWIESRYGSNLGRFHVPSVYLHLLQAERPSVLKHLKGKGALRFTSRPTRAELASVSGRAKKKAKWALDELKALRKMSQGNPKALLLRGSFAGAFGMPQFIPSSYVAWAKSADKGKPADLTKPADAIRSVAYYLRQSGWRKDKPKTHVKALLRYNNSLDYANAILSLASRTKAQKLASSAGGAKLQD